MDTTADRLARLSGTMAGWIRGARKDLNARDIHAAIVKIDQALAAYEADYQDTMERIRALTLEGDK